MIDVVEKSGTGFTLPYRFLDMAQVWTARVSRSGAPPWIFRPLAELLHAQTLEGRIPWIGVEAGLKLRE